MLTKESRKESNNAVLSESPTDTIPYPWQQAVWQRIQQQISQDKTPHALLLAGQQGIGKWHFAHSLANYLLCVSPRADLACGQCRSCQLIAADTHPDKKVFMPESEGKVIRIEQVRELSEFVTKTAQQGGRKVIILGPVEQLNGNSANALLKSLEEPAGDTVLILYTHVLSGVIATIRSRCQRITMPTPVKQQSVEWLNSLKIDDAEALLELAGGAPLIARDMVEGDYLEHLELFVKGLYSLSTQQQGVAPDISIASSWLAISVPHLTQWWMQLISQLVQLQGLQSQGQTTEKTSGSTDKEMTIGDYISSILHYHSQVNQQWLFKFSDKLLRLRQQQLSGSNPNMQLLCEELLLDWQVIIRRSK